MDRGRQYEEQGLLSRTRSFSGSSEESSSADFELDALEEAYARYSPSTPRPKWWPERPRRQRHNSKVVKARHLPFARPRRRRSLFARSCHLISYAPYIILSFILVYGVFFPSYSTPPQRYIDLRNRVLSSEIGGAANLNNEKIFVAASLYDLRGGLVSGEWGWSVRTLIDILGHENVFLSVYENDPDEESKHALNELHDSLPCHASIVYEHLDTSQLPHMTTPDGSQHLQRIAFLAEVRNRALRPLEDKRFNAYHTRWDKLLYLNDVAFDPIDAANLLFNTNVDESTGKSKYRAACAVDFINPFKFYDTFATRDVEGYEMGVPFYPWFTSAGNATSRQDVLNQTDAVRVKSCWGGMVAFEAKWFQPHRYDLVDGDLVVPSRGSDGTGATAGARPVFNEVQDPDAYNDLRDSSDLQLTTPAHPTVHNSTTSPPGSQSIPPLRFRAETEPYWDASECCLIHADLAHRPLSGAVGPAVGSADGDSGIYMNPYIRVAYSRAVLNWLPFTRRFESLYPFVHRIANVIGKRPGYNPRRLEQPGDEVVDYVWQWNDKSRAAIGNGTAGQLPNGLEGSFQQVTRKARPGQFCGTRKLQYIRDHPHAGEAPWASAEVPLIY